MPRIRKVVHQEAYRLEAEVLPGLEPLAKEELESLPGVRECVAERGFLSFGYRGEWRALCDLKLAVAVYLLTPFAVSRPKALLGQQHFDRLHERIALIRHYDPAQTFSSFRFSAAGKDSAVFKRLAEALERETGLAYDPEAGELLMRFRPASQGGWEVLLRLTPRPLSARPYRRCNLPGGLNATVAAAMVHLSQPKLGDHMLNAMCGSGTLLLERHLQAAARLLGCDVSPKALTCARENLAAGGALEVELLEADATRLDFPAGSFDAILCDLPWGDAVSSHGENARLYPAFLQEMTRVGTPQARLVVLSHELKLMDRVLEEQHAWRAKEALQVFHGGHYPRIYVLERVRS